MHTLDTIFLRLPCPYTKKKSKWKRQIYNVLEDFSHEIQLNKLVANHLDGIEELIIIPHLLLHQIPFAALPISDEKYLLDKFRIRYVPSCQILEICRDRQRQKKADTCTYGIVENTLEDLPFASFEAEQIALLHNVSSHQRLQGRAATRQSYFQLAQKVQGIHACHHAQSFFDQPLRSELQLADDNITLADLLTPSWQLPHLLEVFLSCCETNLGVTDVTDNLLTIATGFLCAGATSVVSTLWSVEDLATALLATFYYQHREKSKSRAKALQQAQVQLRDLKKEEFVSRKDIQKLCEQAKSKIDRAATNLVKLPEGSAEYLNWEKEYSSSFQLVSTLEKIAESGKECPFSAPFYWAAFVRQGLP